MNYGSCERVAPTVAEKVTLFAFIFLLFAFRFSRFVSRLRWPVGAIFLIPKTKIRKAKPHAKACVAHYLE